MYHLLLSVGFKLYFLHVPQKGALELHPCLVFAFTLRFVFNFLSLVNYQFPTFAVVFYTYDATESHILKLCLKKNKHSYKHVFWHRIWYLIIGQ